MCPTIGTNWKKFPLVKVVAEWMRNFGFIEIFGSVCVLKGKVVRLSEYYSLIALDFRSWKKWKSRKHRRN